MAIVQTFKQEITPTAPILYVGMRAAAPCLRPEVLSVSLLPDDCIGTKNKETWHGKNCCWEI